MPSGGCNPGGIFKSTSSPPCKAASCDGERCEHEEGGGEGVLGVLQPGACELEEEERGDAVDGVQLAMHVSHSCGIVAAGGSSLSPEVEQSASATLLLSCNIAS